MVNAKTTITGVFLETGEIPLGVFAQKLCIKNWTHIKKGMANAPLTVTTNESQNENHPWTERIKTEFSLLALVGSTLK